MDIVRHREQLGPQGNDLRVIDVVPRHVGCRREPEVACVQPASEVQHHRLGMTVQEHPCPVVQLFGTQRNGLLIAGAQASVLDVNLDLIDDITCPVIAEDGLRRPSVECPSIESPQEGGSLAGELDLGHHTSVA